MKAFFFGCWNEPGHFWYMPGGALVATKDEPPIACIDGGWAPRRWKSGLTMYRNLVHHPPICWIAEGSRPDDRRQIHHDTEEWPQGTFLLHRFSGDLTLISWWDRCQGDTRGHCNSNFVLVDDGKPSAGRMIAELVAAFPHVYQNLMTHNVQLVEARP